jgi:hypothetical protein
MARLDLRAELDHEDHAANPIAIRAVTISIVRKWKRAMDEGLRRIAGAREWAATAMLTATYRKSKTHHQGSQGRPRSATFFPQSVSK